MRFQIKWGGFIGVDIFFVISGFLISTIIFNNLEKNTFSFSQFYARRIKRIFPALLVVLITSLVFGSLALFLDEYKQLGKHTAAGAGFVANFVLWKESGYFDIASELKPLLHLWSLGIEEQFYIIWPFLLWIVWRAKLNPLALSIIFAAISFAYNVYQIQIDWVADFYSPQTRFWELVCGGILAWLSTHRSAYLERFKICINHYLCKILYRKAQTNNGRALSNLCAFTGIILLVYGFYTIKKEMPFPGLWALIPISSSVLIIFAGENGGGWISKRILSNKILVWFGLISFPLYLWHWPLLSFANILVGQPDRIIKILCVFTSIILAWLTYRFVERPIRFGKDSRVKIFILFISMATTGILGYMIYINSPSEITTEADPTNALNAAAANCKKFFPDWSTIGGHECRMQKIRGNKIAIVGDSHAQDLYLGISEQTDGGVVLFSAIGAAPFIDVSSCLNVTDPNTLKYRINNYKLIDRAYDFIIKDKNITTVILGHNPDCSYNDSTKDMQNLQEKDQNMIVENGLRRTLDVLTKANKEVLIVLDSPHLPHTPNLCGRFKKIKGKDDNCAYKKQYFDALKKYTNVVNKVIKDYPQVKTYDLYEPFCDDKICYIADKNKILYRDLNHLNNNGSRFVAPFILKNLN